MLVWREIMCPDSMFEAGKDIGAVAYCGEISSYANDVNDKLVVKTSGIPPASGPVC